MSHEQFLGRRFMRMFRVEATSGKSPRGIQLLEIPTAILVGVQIGAACSKHRVNVRWGQGRGALTTPADDTDEGAVETLTHDCAVNEEGLVLTRLCRDLDE